MRTPVSAAVAIAATAVAIAVGLVTLLGYLLPPEYTEIRTLILGWAVTLAAVATVVAIISLVMAHSRKLTARRNPDRYSIFTLIFFFITFIAGVATYFLGYRAEYQQLFVNSIQVPVEASLLAVLSVTLALASFRLFQRRRGVLAVTFFISALVFLLLNSGVSALLEMVFPAGLWESLLGPLLYIVQILPVAGARGILLGIALGSILAGLRIVFGAERPYNG